MLDKILIAEKNFYKLYTLNNTQSHLWYAEVHTENANDPVVGYSILEYLCKMLIKKSTEIYDHCAT